MIKKLVLVLVVIIAIKGYGQEGTASPYSYYGIGSLKFKGTVENRSMGGLSVYTDSIHVNLRNPASYGGENLEILNKEARPVKFTLGGTYSNIGFKSETDKGKAETTTFDYLAIAVPVGKFGFGFGLLPYTATGYKLETLNSQGDISEKYTGKGGLNKVFLGFGYQIAKGLSLGVDFQYNFGVLQNSNLIYTYDDDHYLTQYQSAENNRSNISGINLNFGVTYKKMLTERLEIVSGLTYAPEADLNSKNSRSISTIKLSSDREETKVNSIDQDLVALGINNTKLKLPSKYAFGLGLGEPYKWFVGAEATFLKSSTFTNSFYGTSQTKYNDALTLAFGGFYIPEFNSINNYYKRIVYRAGVHTEDTGLVLNGEAIKEFGISFGVGLPVGGFFSNTNVGFEIGNRGTTNQNLIKENFINVQISLSLNDRWFQKRKFN